MTASPSLSLLEAFCSVPDPRARQGLRHPLSAVLALLSVATMCGCRSVYAALQWGRDQGREMAGKLGLAKHGIPCDGMMSQLLRRLDVVAFEKALERWAAAWPATATAAGGADRPDPIAIDGKTLRGSQGHEVPGVHLLAAYAARLGLVLKQISAGANSDDGGEIIAAPKLLKGLVLQGKVITGDAIHVQRPLCRQILKQGGDYLLTVKENQPALHRELVDLFRSPVDPLLHSRTDKHGGRTETRTIWISGELRQWRDWPGLKTCGMIKRETWNRTPGQYQCEVAYVISSLDHRQHKPEVFLEINRGHWGIENKLHYVKDVSMGEDACRVRTGSSPQVLSGIRNSVLALLRGAGWTNIAAALRHHAVKVHEVLRIIGFPEN